MIQVMSKDINRLISKPTEVDTETNKMTKALFQAVVAHSDLRDISANIRQRNAWWQIRIKSNTTLLMKDVIRLMQKLMCYENMEQVILQTIHTRDNLFVEDRRDYFRSCIRVRQIPRSGDNKYSIVQEFSLTGAETTLLFMGLPNDEFHDEQEMFQRVTETVQSVQECLWTDQELVLTNMVQEAADHQQLKAAYDDMKDVVGDFVSDQENSFFGRLWQHFYKITLPLPSKAELPDQMSQRIQGKLSHKKLVEQFEGHEVCTVLHHLSPRMMRRAAFCMDEAMAATERKQIADPCFKALDRKRKQETLMEDFKCITKDITTNYPLLGTTKFEKCQRALDANFARRQITCANGE